MASKGVKFKDASGNAVYPCPYYPVGSIYISVNNINPTTYFGGTWEAFGTGRTLVGVDTSQTEFNTVKKTGGEKTHKLSEAEMPKHNHTSSKNFGYDCGTSGWGALFGSYSSGYVYQSTNIGNYLNTKGNDQPHNNLQPYITVYMWLRTA